MHSDFLEATFKDSFKMPESDDIKKYLEEYKNIQDTLLDFLENEQNIQKNIQNLDQLLKNKKIRDYKYELRLFLHFLLEVANNHFHEPNFFKKIDQVLLFFKAEFKKYFSNSEIFNIFESNKRILLFLIEQKIITFDEFFVQQIIDKYLLKNYQHYFAPEIKQLINEKLDILNDPYISQKLIKVKNEELPDNFYEFRNEGENESFICKLIREDSVEDFIAFIAKNNISPNTKIKPSIYESNPYLLQKQGIFQEGVTLIEYAAFFGSIQIFTFLEKANVELTPSLWLCAIHSKNAELIHLLEYFHIKPPINSVGNNKNVEEESFNECFKESIKCHHNDIANYFLNNYLQIEDENSKETFIQSLKYYNFSFIQSECINESFYFLCINDYYSLAKIICKRIDININEIQNHIL